MGIEDRIEKKIYEIANCALNRFIKPTIKINEVKQIDEKMMEDLKRNYQIEGMILDVDETIRKNMQAIPECNKEWIDMVRTKLKIIIVSNGIDNSVREMMKSKGIGYIGFAHKPLRKNFLKACKDMQLEPDKVLVVGDSLWADIHGGNKNKMKTAWVKEER